MPQETTNALLIFGKTFIKKLSKQKFYIFANEGMKYTVKIEKSKLMEVRIKMVIPSQNGPQFFICHPPFQI